MPRIILLSCLLAAGLSVGAPILGTAPPSSAQSRTIARGPYISHPLKRLPSSPTADGAVTVSCILAEKEGDVYKKTVIYATSNVDALQKCTFTCKVSRKGAEELSDSCSITIKGRQTAGCFLGENFHDYTAFVDGSYSCTQ